MAAKRSLGVQMYRSYADDSHCPSILIVASLMPARATVVVAPTWELCPE